jgi:hypothetical protein
MQLREELEHIYMHAGEERIAEGIWKKREICNIDIWFDVLGIV